MFRCELTNRLTYPGDKCYKLVTKVRHKQYRALGSDEIIGEGIETVEELSVCEQAYKAQLAEGFEPEVVRDG